LHITHWSSQDLAWQAITEKVVPAISAAMIRRILHEVDLQPHRTHYWKTARWDAEFKQRAEKVLWCYSNAYRLAQQGLRNVCVDEIPTYQVLKRYPIRRAIPGSIEQQEFEYTCHETINILVFLVVHTGYMEAKSWRKRRRALYSGAGTFPPATPPFERRISDSGWRSQSHCRRYSELPRRRQHLVASALYPGSCIVAQSSGDLAP
jgi:hypothetical protein